MQDTSSSTENNIYYFNSLLRRSSIYDVHTEVVRLRRTHVDEEGSQLYVDDTGRKYGKLQPTVSLARIKSENFSSI